MGVAWQAFSILLVFALLAATLRRLNRANTFSLARMLPAWSVRRVTAKPARNLEPIERLVLTPQHTLHLVRIQGRDILLATHASGCTLLNPTLLPETTKGANA